MNWKHLVFSCGGSRTIIASGMVNLLLEFYGIRATNWISRGGVSGGAIVQAIASVLSPAEVLEMVLHQDFGSMVPARTSKTFQYVRAFLGKERCHGESLPAEGLFDSEPLGEFIDRLVPSWPEGLWILAMDQDFVPIVFTRNGVFEWRSDRRPLFEPVVAEPVSVGLAVRASCSVPMLFTPPRLVIGGRERRLYDGAFSVFGLCPVGVAMKMWHARPKEILAVDVGRDPALSDGWVGMVRKAYKRWYRVPFDPSWPVDAEGVFRLEPFLSITSLKLHLPLAEKWRALLQVVEQVMPLLDDACSSRRGAGRVVGSWLSQLGRLRI